MNLHVHVNLKQPLCKYDREFCFSRQSFFRCASRRFVKKMSAIKCNFCELQICDTEYFIRHLRIHKQWKITDCAFSSCGISFKSLSAYKTHLRQRHFRMRNPIKKQFECSVGTCGFIDADFKIMTKHLNQHLSAGQPVFCPFGCRKEKPFFTVNSLKIHKMYFHRNGNSRGIVNSKSSAGSEPLLCEEDSVVIDTGCNGEEMADSVGTIEPNDPASKIVSLFGTLFLKLLSKNHVTDTAIQEIVSALGEASTLQAVFVNGSDSVDREENLKCRSSNLFDYMFGEKGVFRSPYMRKKFFRDNYKFVPPIQVPLQRDEEHNESFYFYVPILETLSTMLDDKKTYEAVFRKKTKVPGYLKDYDDGLKFKNSQFFTHKTLNIFIYQDAAEMVVNALGNATSRHKLLCVYMVLGNLDPHLRCLTENVQLILLCKTKDFSCFGGNRVFRRLIEDIKVLEEEGIVVHGGGFAERVYGSVFTTMNDNLGAHQLAGLVENFSTSSYFCRSCYVELDKFKSDWVQEAEMRTPQTHLLDLQMIENNPSVTPYRGVKADCIFDELRHFKLFHFGAAPCVAHDLFEGWVNYDLFIILKRLAKENNISAHFIQGRINDVAARLKLNTKISIDFSRKAKNFKAKACDIWHVVQVIPFIFVNKSVDHEDPMLMMLLLIKNITDIVTSPVVSIEQTFLLDSFITEYLELRATQFDTPVRPKHHFTTHYPWLIRWLGPLMSYCTLFCERKHCFFKRALRSTLNFKNVLKFCSEQHQYYQALLHIQTNRFELKFLVNRFVESYEYLPQNVQFDLNNFALIGDNFVYAEDAVYCGHTYSQGTYLFLHFDDFGASFYVLRIKLIVYDKIKGQIWFYGDKQPVKRFPEKGILEMQMHFSENIAVAKNISDLVDPTPLTVFQEQNTHYLFIKHALPLP